MRRASELIKQLQDLIETKGDLPVILGREDEKHGMIIEWRLSPQAKFRPQNLLSSCWSDEIVEEDSIEICPY